jgi:hypothetical protein
MEETFQAISIGVTGLHQFHAIWNKRGVALNCLDMLLSKLYSLKGNG